MLERMRFMQKLKQNFKIFGISILIPLAVGGLSALLTRSGMDIYSDVKMPPLTPPSWLFPVVWSILFLLMGISSGLVWKVRMRNPQKAADDLVFYALSLIFNFLWSIFFFNLRWFFFSFIWLLGLWYLILRTIFSYKRVCPIAAKLQIPYLLWVTFAGYLNFAIWLIN